MMSGSYWLLTTKGPNAVLYVIYNVLGIYDARFKLQSFVNVRITVGCGRP